MAKQKLILEEEDGYEFLAFGISCHWKDFRVAWALNKEAGFNLVRKDNIQLSTGKQTPPSAHSLFEQEDPDNRVKYLLLSNKGSNFTLSKSYKDVDHFLIVEGYIDLFDSETLLKKLKRIKNFQLVVEVPHEHLAKWQYDLFDR